MLVEVTQEDIDEGEKRNCNACPVALALRRSFGALDVSVTGYCVHIFKVGVIIEQTKTLPSNAIEFIKRYDIGMPVKPFEFYMEK